MRDLAARAILAAAVLLAGAGCSDSVGTPHPLDAGVDSAGLAADTGPSTCCMAAASTCSTAFPPTERCVSGPQSDGGFSQYGRWTCSSGTCSDNGQSCALGDTCMIADLLIDCQGVVVQCP